MSNNKNYSKNVTIIADSAFTPGEVEEVNDRITQEKRPLSAEEKMAAFFASMGEDTVSTPVFALPSNGEHIVVIDSYEYKNGYRDNGDYFQIALKELKKNITWNMSLPADTTEFMRFLGEINMYNKGIVYGLKPMEALGKLQSKKFRVWTQQFKNDKGEDRTKTYSNPVKYEKFARFVAYQEADKKQKDAEYKAKKDQQDKAPWKE